VKQDGIRAEEFAAAELERRGLKLVARNYRCRFGEIDLILREGSTLVFVEVRLRADSEFGGAGESITAVKRRRLVMTAKHYLARLGVAPRCRFDVVLLDRTGALSWIKDAFTE
jgi:putative endonuclease